MAVADALPQIIMLLPLSHTLYLKGLCIPSLSFIMYLQAVAAAEYGRNEGIYMPKLELPDSVNTVIENTTGELTTNAGKTFGDIWFLIFGGISHTADKRRAKYAHDLSIYKQELSDSISKIPKDKQIEPSLQITAQALENSKYSIEEKELREMFTSLVSNSMNSDFLNHIHPSFAEIIKQMSVIDARLLKKFKVAHFSGIPICNYCVSTPGKPGYSIALENVFLELPEISLEICSTSISSLERLGLIQIPSDIYLNAPEYYDIFKQHSQCHLIQKEFPNAEISIQNRVAKLTPLGQSFVRVCIPD